MYTRGSFWEIKNAWESNDNSEMSLLQNNQASSLMASTKVCITFDL